MKLVRVLSATISWIALGGVAAAQMPGYAAPGGMPYGGTGYPGQQTQMVDGPAYGPPMGQPTMAPEPFAAPDVTFDPSGARRRIGVVYASMDALYYKLHQGAPSEVIDSAGDGSPMLTGASPMWSHRVLPRLTAGYIFDRGLAVEGTYFYIDNFSSWNAQNSTNNINGFIPQGNFLNADNFLMTNNRKLQNAEINLIETNHFFNFIAGFRYLELRDRVGMRSNNGGAVGTVNIDTYNRLLGGQVGVRAGYDFGLFGLQGFAKAGLYQNDASESTRIANSAAVGVDRNLHNGGQCESFLAELQGMVTYRPSASWTLRAGYNAMWLAQVALANDQVLTPPNSFNTGLILNQGSDMIVHGPFAGAEFRW